MPQRSKAFNVRTWAGTSHGRIAPDLATSGRVWGSLVDEVHSFTKDFDPEGTTVARAHRLRTSTTLLRGSPLFSERPFREESLPSYSSSVTSCMHDARGREGKHEMMLRLVGLRCCPPWPSTLAVAIVAAFEDHHPGHAHSGWE
jgi:hypothetical protein